MAETLHRSSDVPNFDAYPASVPEAEQNTTALDQRASQVGRAAGKAVVALRKAQGTVKGAADKASVHDISEAASARINDLAGVAKANAQEWRQSAVSRLEGLRGAALEQVSDL